MKLPVISISGLRAFEAVIRLGSMADAANELGISRSALTSLIKRLEKNLDVSLFYRGSDGRIISGARPTNRALRIASRITAVLEDLYDCLEINSSDA